jgi:ABC-type lipoprotein release transport system permease subunit
LISVQVGEESMFFTYLRRELRRRKKSALVISMGLALGIALVITVNSVSAGMQQAQGKVLQSLYGLGTDMTVSKAAPASTSSGSRPSFNFGASSGTKTQSSDRVTVVGFQTLSSSVVSQVAGQANVTEAVGGLNLRVMKVNGTFTPGSVSGSAQSPQGGRTPGQVKGGGAKFSVNSYTADGVDTAHLGLGPLTSSKITSGKTFTASQNNAKVAIVDSAYASQNSLSVGNALTISGTAYSIIGIATANSGQAAADVYLPLQQAQTLANSANNVTTIYVQTTSSQAINSVKAAIQKNIPGTTVTTSADLASTVSGSLSTASNLATNVGKWLSIAVLIAAFLVAGLLTSSAVSRRVREFGTLKALGWKSSRVTGQVIGESLVNGLVGGALGIGLGLAGAYTISAISPTLTAQLGSGSAASAGGRGGGFGGGGFGAARKATSSTVNIALSAPVSLSTIAVAVALAIAGGLVAGTFGGWRASRLRPADALRRVE